MKKPRVRKTLIHVIGQISYKINCLETVLNHLKYWDNQDLVVKALEEIIDVHDRYKNFTAKTQEEARMLIEQKFD
jgi:predicted KAP-like P-loop ATPase